MTSHTPPNEPSQLAPPPRVIDENTGQTPSLRESCLPLLNSAAIQLVDLSTLTDQEIVCPLPAAQTVEGHVG